MKIFYSDHIELPLPEGHRFPITKYRMLRERLIAAGIGELIPATPVTEVDLVRVHSAEFIDKVKTGSFKRQEIRRIGFPWTKSLYDRAIHSAGGTLCAARAALTDHIRAHLAGGTHHAHFDWSQGFCTFNDAVIVARALQAEKLLERVLIIDLDVHQGNGTATLCQDVPSIFTFSIHGAKNFPFKKATSDFDVALPDGTEDSDYLDYLEESLWRIINLARADMAIYIAGADPFMNDRFGKMCMTKAGLLKRDKYVFDAVKEAELPLAICMGGGYAKEVADIVDIHAATVMLASQYVH